MDTMQNLFGAAENDAVEEKEAVVTGVDESERKKKEAKEARDARINKMKDSFSAFIRENPDVRERIRMYSDSIEVVNTLGWGTSGNIILDHERTKATNTRKVLQVPVIVGYRLRSNWKEPISYQTEEWTQNEAGLWVAERVTKVWEPGTEIDLTRLFMSVLCSIPEISFTFANGKMKQGSAKTTSDPRSKLEALHFVFKSVDGQPKMNVNSDEVKLNVGYEDENGTWHVKPEFEATFGYLNNPSAHKTRTRSSGGDSYTMQDLLAHYVQDMLQQNEI